MDKYLSKNEKQITKLEFKAKYESVIKFYEDMYNAVVKNYSSPGALKTNSKKDIDNAISFFNVSTTIAKNTVLTSCIRASMIIFNSSNKVNTSAFKVGAAFSKMLEFSMETETLPAIPSDMLMRCKVQEYVKQIQDSMIDAIAELFDGVAENLEADESPSF